MLFLLTSCIKDHYHPMVLEPELDIRDERAGLFLPTYMGSNWVYNQYQFFGHQPVKIGIQTCRYDSIPNYFFNYDNNNNFLSYGLWYRDGLNLFRSGGGQILMTDVYTDSVKGKIYLLENVGSAKHYIYGGYDTLDTKFGKIQCIKTFGSSGNSSSNYWFRYFGLKIGVIKEEEYIFNGVDTTAHYILELDHYKINK